MTCTSGGGQTTGSSRVRNHLGSSGCCAQSDGQAVSILPLASTLCWSQTRFFPMSLRLSQQPTETAAPFLAHQFQLQPQDICTDGLDDTLHSPLSNTDSNFSLLGQFS